MLQAKDTEWGREHAMGNWDPDQYLKFKKERTQPSLDLTARLVAYRTESGEAFSPDTVLDLGCGPGNSTRVVADAFPDARVLGVDSSPDMVEEAIVSSESFEGRVAYKLFDATEDPLPLACELGSEEGFDLVFSNACIQWVPDNQALIRRLMASLAPGGLLAVQVPVNAQEPIYQCIYRVVDSPQWAPHFKKRRFFTTLKVTEYFDTLADCAGDFTMWQTSYLHRMPSVDAVVEWFRGTGLRPFLEQLDPGLRPGFISDVRAEMAKVALPRPNGEVLLPFPRLFFIAEK